MEVEENVGQAAVYGLIALALGYFSDQPAYTHFPPDRALVKLSLVHPGAPAGECRRRTPEELAQLAPNMRKVLDCPRGRLPVLVFSGTIATAEEVRELASLGVAGYVNEYSAVQHILPSLAPHLFPDNFNRRGSPRVVLGIPVAYRFGNTIAAALTLNLSKGGLAIRTMSPLPQGAKLRARFRLPGSKRDIEADSRIAWSDRRVGMGLQFEKVDPVDQAAIDEFVDQHFFTNRKV